MDSPRSPDAALAARNVTGLEATMRQTLVLPHHRRIRPLPQFAFIEHSNDVKCPTCGETARDAGTTSYVGDAAGKLHDFQRRPIGPNEAYSVRCPSGHDVPFKTDGENAVFRTQYTSPAEGTYENRLATLQQ
jgi:hypothetical protein